MPLVVPAELPTADVVIVVSDDGGRVIVFVDPRVPFVVAADAIAHVRRVMAGPGDLLAGLAKTLQSRPYALAGA